VSSQSSVNDKLFFFERAEVVAVVVPNAKTTRATLGTRTGFDCRLTVFGRMLK
jgi:hypothetical protein